MNQEEKLSTIESLLQRPYWIIDLLPCQVPAHSPGQYFAIEQYWLNPAYAPAMRQRYADLLLRLNCYYDLDILPSSYSEEYNPPPEKLVQMISGLHGQLDILVGQGDCLITLDSSDTYATVYNPDFTLLTLLRQLAASAGLFVWQPEQFDKGKVE